MAEFRVKGKEMIVKEAKPHGGGGMVYVPKKWAGEKCAVIRGIVEEK